MRECCPRKGGRGRSLVINSSTPHSSNTDQLLSVIPVPIFGGGDCYSSQDYWEKMEQSGVDGVMIGRGALIKPWIFTEIKERREWDISARERLEYIRKVSGIRALSGTLHIFNPCRTVVR